ncbi:hypothetical protein QYF36_008542 [Acer negundo]|nr:hypothetical protein QYF36_008542 [Acer negundo]
MASRDSSFFSGLFSFVLFVFLGIFSAEAAVKKYQFDVQVKNVSRLCHAKPIVTVNGGFPGPTIYVREGDRVLINVTNHAQYNMSIHWHGLKQYRNGQRGTLWWHAHIHWLRATVYGAIVIMPKPGTQFPFQQPNREEVLLLGEWWHSDVEELVKQGNKMGLPPNMSDAHTINGKPGPLFPCSEKHTFAMEVESGKTYLLRIINAALNDELFFAIAVGVPTGGWTAIRFRADNPGVWFMHCHLELHTGWGLKMAFVVEDGAGPDQSVLPPPKDLPPC